MNLSFYIAKRYIFSKKSHNAINIISMISVFGITIATMAMVCALSVFNGFTDLAFQSFSAIDPQLQVSVVKGKVFDPTDAKFSKIKEIEGVKFISESLEENALIKYEDRQAPVLIKGVSPEFLKQVNVENITVSGDFLLEDGDVQFGVVGAGVSMSLGIRNNFIHPIEIYTPKRNVKINMANPASAYSISHVYPSGVFLLNQQQYDEQVMFVSLDLARELFRYENEISSLNIMLDEDASVDGVKAEIKNLLGKEYTVKDRFEQQEGAFRMVNIEKWVTFLILLLILLIATFNIIGSLSMLILEKKEDITILKNMGAGNKLILRIFAFEGWMISFIGAFAGVCLGLILCLLQENFGLLKLGSVEGAFITDSYPVVVQTGDVIITFITVTLIGFLAVLYPINNLKKQLK